MFLVGFYFVLNCVNFKTTLCVPSWFLFFLIVLTLRPLCVFLVGFYFFLIVLTLRPLCVFLVGFYFLIIDSSMYMLINMAARLH